MLSSNDLEFIRRSVLFQDIDPIEKDRMIGRCHVHKTDIDEPLFRAGQEVSRVYLVLSGVIELYRGAEDGKHAILGLREIGEIAGASAALAGISHYTTGQPVDRCRFLEVPLDVFLELLDQNPGLARKLTSRLAGNL